MRITIFFLLIFTLRLGAQNDVEQSRQRLEEYLSASEYTEPEIVDIIDFSFYLFDTLKQKGLTDSSKLLVKKVLKFTEQKGSEDLRILTEVTGFIQNEAINSEDAYSVLKDYPVKNIQSDALRAKACKMIGEYHLWYAEKNAEALKFFLQALELYERLEDKEKAFLVCMHVKSVYYNRVDTEKQLFYLKEAEEYITENDTTALIEMKLAYANLYGQRGKLLFQAGKTDSAYIIARKAIPLYDGIIDLAENSGKVDYLLLALNNSAATLSNLGDNEAALQKSRQALGIAEKHNKADKTAHSLYTVSAITGRLGNAKEAEKIAKRGYAFAQNRGMEHFQALFGDNLYEIFKAQGKYKEALHFSEEHQLFQDSVLSLENSKVIAEVEAQYQTEKKEKEILKQQNQILELEAENERVAGQRNRILGGGFLLLLLGFLTWRFNKIRMERNDKKAFAEALILAQEEERKRIARDLHDGVGQSLLLIKKQLADNHSVSMENQKMIGDTLDEVRSLSRSLHPFQLEKFGLKATLEDTFSKAERSSDLFFSYYLPDDLDASFGAKSQIHLYRTIQEAISNVIKHAEATAVQINIEEVRGKYLIKIKDNGKGFDHELTVAKSKSLGLQTMYERISAIGGNFKILPGDPKGTVIKIEVEPDLKSI